MKRFFLQVLIIILILTAAACGPSKAEQNASATELAAEIFGTQTAQVPTSTVTFTPSPTATVTPTSTVSPTPTLTPTLTPTPTPAWMDAGLNLNDLPEGYQPMSAQVLMALQQNLPPNSISFGFADEAKSESVMGYLVSYPTPVEQITFDGMLPQMLDLFASAYGATTTPALISGLEDVGEIRLASTFVSEGGEMDLRWENVLFRRGEIAVFLFVFYPVEDDPSVPAGDLALLLDQRLSQKLPAEMNLFVNYGHDIVEGLYEVGHEVIITVTENDGVTVKATAATITEAKTFWSGETGFQTSQKDWSPELPDMQPYDWVIAEVDNGEVAWVQLGDIKGEVRFDLDRITGAIEALWISNPIQTECLDWGSGGYLPYGNRDGGTILANGVEPYTCSWGGEWDIQPWQDIGVGYFTPDGHWVANAFRDERWMAMWTYDPPPGFLKEAAHSYYFDWSYTVPVIDNMIGNPLWLKISNTSKDIETPIYDGYVLIQTWPSMSQQAWTGSGCEVVSQIHQDQPVRFVWGWVSDYSMTYEEAFAHFSSFKVKVYWDGRSGSADLVMGELLPYKNRDMRWEYLCTLTEH